MANFGYNSMKKLLLLLSIVLTGCGGGGSSDPSSTTSTAKAESKPVITCLISSTIAPAGYTGSYAIPTPTQRLVTTIQRSVGIKDYYPDNKCKYAAELDKLQTLGVDRIWVYNYGVWDDFNKPVWTIDNTSWQIPKESFTYLVTEAKKRNIKVFLALQFTAFDNQGTMLPFGVDISSALLQKMLDSHHSAIVDYAKYGESIGLAGISIDWNAFYIKNWYDYPDQWATNMVSIANDIRSNFSGVITYGQIGSPHYDTRIYNVVDELHIHLAPRLTQIENANISVSLLRDKFTDLINQFYIDYHQTSKPIIWEISVQSRDKYFTEGWVEDGFCVNNCIQNSYVTDFSIQAMGIEAALEAIAMQNKFTTKSVDFHTSYWHTDTMTPGSEGFPNLSQSIRGKPAENIVKYWFSRG